jgi:tetratricopeptide (TPR) repeat protein
MTLGFMHSVSAAETVSNKAAPHGKAGLSESKNAGYWFRKGSLCATYGNDRAAIAYFNKTLALNPGHKGAYFSQGVSYGQLGQHQKALEAIDRAIALEPQNGHFYYGRGRVHLQAGNNDQAMMDFKKAAELGDEDAQVYLGEIPAPRTIKLD